MKVVLRSGDYARSWWMQSFWDGTIDLSLQMDVNENIILDKENAERVRTFKNPLRDPVIIVKRNGRYSLKDGFHRLCEAFARKYKRRLWTVVLDMDIESDTDTDS